MDRTRQTGPTLLICLALAAATLAVFWPVSGHNFLNYDDPVYVELNPHVVSGLSWENVTWAFQAGYAYNWHPLTWLSHMLDAQLFGLKPGWHHLTNLLLHSANALLLLLLLKRLTGALWRSAFVAALFALHPLHVQSVAWVAERKDVLSGFFFMLTIWAYSEYVRRREEPLQGAKSGAESTVRGPQPTAAGKESQVSRKAGPKSNVQDRATRWYGLALVLFACGLMSKPMLVTLPFVLLLLDCWPLGRLQPPMGRSAPPAEPGPAIENQASRIANLFREKMPFFLLTLVSVLITLTAQQEATDLLHLPIGARLGNAAVSYVAYLAQTLWPAGLAVFYPHATDMSPAAPILAAAMLLALTIAILRLGRRHPSAPVGWFWYLGMLVPVIGLVEVGTAARADRYTYLPLIGIFIMAVWGVASLAVARPRARTGLALAGGVILLALAVAAHQQVRLWRDSRTLFARAAQVTRNNFVAWICMGIADLKANDPAAAAANFTHALECARPHHAEAGVNFYMGRALQMQGKWLEALPYLADAAVSVEQRPVKSYLLGLSLMEAGRLSEAKSAFEQALAASPHDPQFCLGLAALLQRQGRPEMAEQFFSSALAGQAESYCDTALDAQPPNAALRRIYAAALARQGQAAQAAGQLEAALRIEPTNALANFELAELLNQLRQNREAISRYSKALEVDPKLVGALNNLAWLLATAADDGVRDGPRAVGLAERACRATEWKQPVAIGTLAAACAEAGRFTDAVAMGEKARDLARALKQEEVAARNEQLLKLYRAGKPYHEAAPPGK